MLTIALTSVLHIQAYLLSPDPSKSISKTYAKRVSKALSGETPPHVKFIELLEIGCFPLSRLSAVVVYALSYREEDTWRLAWTYRSLPFRAPNPSILRDSCRANMDLALDHFIRNYRERLHGVNARRDKPAAQERPPMDGDRGHLWGVGAPGQEMVEGRRGPP